MIAHLAEEIQPHLVQFHTLRQPHQKPCTIAVVQEDLLPSIPSYSHMVNRTSVLDSQ